MEIKSNVPAKCIVYASDGTPISVGQRIRIQFYPSARNMEHGYVYAGGGIIGNVIAIYSDALEIQHPISTEYIKFSRILILKAIDENEDFNTVPYINEDEREFWRTHWMTSEGIKEKTPEDLAWLDEFAKKHKVTA